MQLLNHKASRLGLLIVILLLLIVLLLSILSFSASAETTSASTNTAEAVIPIRITDTVRVASVNRPGINLGSHDQYGAAQYLKNIVVNPGFEAGEFGTVFIVGDGGTGTRVQQDNWQTSWNNDAFGIGQPEGFWDGAEYRIPFGSAKGRSGTIAGFTHEDDRYTYTFDSSGTAPDTGSVVYARRPMDGFSLIQAGTFVEVDTAEQRPDSSGAQALRLMPPNVGWQPSHRYYMDSLRRNDTSAGKLMLINGKWHVSVWAKAETAGDTLEIYFWREFGTLFVNETFTLTDEWQQYSVEFDVPDSADPLVDVMRRTDFGDFVLPIPDARIEMEQLDPILELAFRIKDTGGDVWIDDVELSRRDHTNPTAFTDNFVNHLKDLNPGVLRDWGNQLGSTLDNQLSDQFGRKSTGHQPRNRVATSWHYSLHDFLELAQEVGANPWYVIPPTVSQEEMANLMAYLGAPADAHAYGQRRADLGQTEPWTTVFDTIHIEYGNEMWGGNDGADAFIGATLRGGERLGSISNDQLQQVRSSPYFDASRVDLIIGGQYGLPYRQHEIETFSDAHDTIAIAPYYGVVLDDYSSDEEMYYSSYARLFQDLDTGPVKGTNFYLDQAGKGTGLSIYEINLHTTFKTTPIETRNDFVTGLNSGLALPLFMLTYQRDAGVQNQAAFQALQYSHRIGTGEYVRLWGLLRDLEATGRKRPTWLGLELANRAVRGDLITAEHTGSTPSWTQTPVNEILADTTFPLVHSFAYRDGDAYALALFNLDLNSAHTVQLSFPSLVSNGATVHTLSADSIHDDNEDAENVTLTTQTITGFAEGYQLELPANSFIVVEWFRENSPPAANDDSYRARPEVELDEDGSVLANDMDIDADPLTAVLNQAPANGSLSLNDDGTFEYTPDPGFVGTDSFIYLANDGKADSEPTEVKIRVLYYNYMPAVQLSD